MSPSPHRPRAERRHYPPERAFALRLRATGSTGAGELAGQLEHVMSGRCTDFAGTEQLLEALAAALPALVVAPPADPLFPQPPNP